MPKRIWKEQRLRDLKDAIERYMEANQQVPVKWIDEYNELLVDGVKLQKQVKLL